MLNILLKLKIFTIIRFFTQKYNPLLFYKTEFLEKYNIKIIDFEIMNDHTPNEFEIKKFIKLVNTTEGKIAIHCNFPIESIKQINFNEE